MSVDLVKRAREWNFCWPSHEVEVLVPEMADRIEQLEDNLRTLFQLLDLTEESDEGRPFHPINIYYCRELDGLKMEKVLAQLKSMVKGQNDD